MKKIGFLLSFLVFIIATTSCSSIKKDLQKAPNTTNDTVRIANKSLEYEIIIIEPGFNQWLATRQPRGYYDQFWLENRNITLVNTYNNRVLNSIQFDPNLYIQQVDYDQKTNYGYEVNYLLWNWFEFFQERNNQKL